MDTCSLAHLPSSSSSAFPFFISPTQIAIKGIVSFSFCLQLLRKDWDRATRGFLVKVVILSLLQSVSSSPCEPFMLACYQPLTNFTRLLGTTFVVSCTQVHFVSWSLHLCLHFLVPLVNFPNK